jgi:hypothetical protein
MAIWPNGEEARLREAAQNRRDRAAENGMDEIVQRAIAKWPDVPAVFGWLSLDSRGNWAIKGERVQNKVITDFIGRNYSCDSDGRWFFQNGPQRVFVSLGYTPWVLRAEGPDGAKLITHTGILVSTPKAAWLDDGGHLLIEFEGQIGLVHDHDLAALVPHIYDKQGRPPDDPTILMSAAPELGHVWLRLANGAVQLGKISKEELPSRFGYDPDPRPAPGEPEC